MNDLIALLGTLAAIVAPIVGGVAVLAGLYMCWQAFGDARADAKRARLKKDAAGAFEIPDEALKILPELAKSAAGIAIAVMLLGVILLMGTLATNGAADSDSAEPSPSPAAALITART